MKANEIRDLTYKIEEYQKHIDILNESYKEYCEKGDCKAKFFIYFGSSDNFDMTLCEEQVVAVFNTLHDWYTKKIKELGQRIKHLTDE